MCMSTLVSTLGFVFSLLLVCFSCFFSFLFFLGGVLVFPSFSKLGKRKIQENPGTSWKMLENVGEIWEIPGKSKKTPENPGKSLKNLGGLDGFTKGCGRFREVYKGLRV